MFREQCVSVTDLRTKTKQCLDGITRDPKYIFINNRPVAVLVSIRAYEEQFMQPHLVELSENAVDVSVKKQAAAARRTKKSSLINIR